MTKTELVGITANTIGLTEKETGKVVNAFIDAVAGTLAEHEAAASMSVNTAFGPIAFSRSAKITDAAGARSIRIKSAGIVRIVPLRDIEYVDVCQHRVSYHLADGGELASHTSLSEVWKVFAGDPRFMQCHRAVIVNTEHLAQFSAKWIVMRSGAVLPLTRTYRAIWNRYRKHALHNADAIASNQG